MIERLGVSSLEMFSIIIIILNCTGWKRNKCHSVMGGSPRDVSENPVTLERRKRGWRMSCDVGEVTESLEN